MKNTNQAILERGMGTIASNLTPGQWAELVSKLAKWERQLQLFELFAAAVPAPAVNRRAAAVAPKRLRCPPPRPPPPNGSEPYTYEPCEDVDPMPDYQNALTD